MNRYVNYLCKKENHVREMMCKNKQKNKMKDCKNTSGEDVSFISRISQSLTNASLALRTTPTSSSSLCRSSHSEISQNSLELGPFSLQKPQTCKALNPSPKLSSQNLISGLNRWPCSCQCTQRTLAKPTDWLSKKVKKTL